MISPTSRSLFYITLILCVVFFLSAVVAYRYKKSLRFLFSTILSVVMLLGTFGLQINIARNYVHSWAEIPALLGLNKNTEIPLENIEIPQKNEKNIAQSSKIADQKQDYKINFTKVTDPNFLGDGFTGEYFETVFKGPKSHIQQPVRIWAPNGWQNLTNMKVVLFLHGYPSNPEFAARSLGIGKQLGAQIASQKVAPTMVVIPEIRPDQHEPDCVDVKNRPKIATFVVEDIVNLVKTNFPVSHKRADWAISGNSAGAYCAGLLAGIYEETFGNSIILSGYNNPQLGTLKYLSRENQQRFNLSAVFGDAKLPMNIYNFSAGNDKDAKILSESIREVKNPLIKITNVYDENGSHNWKTWYRAFPDAMDWFASANKNNFAQQKDKPDHRIGGPATIATKISIEYLEIAYLTILIIWLIFLIRYFGNLKKIKRFFQKEKAASAFLGDNSSDSSSAEISQAKSLNSQEFAEKRAYRNKINWVFRRWVAAFFASTFTVLLLTCGVGVLVNQKMGTISNLSNITALLQLFGF